MIYFVLTLFAFMLLYIWASSEIDSRHLNDLYARLTRLEEDHDLLRRQYEALRETHNRKVISNATKKVSKKVDGVVASARKAS